MPSTSKSKRENGHHSLESSQDETELIAFLADIHGNYPALEAVLEDLPEEVTDIISLGDIIGGGGKPVECTKTIKKYSDISVQGEYDRVIDCPATPPHDRGIEKKLHYARNQLSPELLDWLTQLPKKDIYNGDFLLCHSHPDPAYNETYIQYTDIHDLAEYLDTYEVSVLVYAHTHTQERFDISHHSNHGEIILNPGSVGHPRDRNPDAAYALFDPIDRNVYFRRVSYDINKTITHIHNAGLPEETAQEILKAK